MNDLTRREFLRKAYQIGGLVGLYSLGAGAVEEARAIGILPAIMGSGTAPGETTSNLLIHSNTTNGSTTFVDSGIGENCPHVIASAGNVQHSTTQQKFGTTSIKFDGTGDYLSIAGSTDWDFGTGDFTIDFWLYPVTFVDHDGVFGWRTDNNNRFALNGSAGPKASWVIKEAGGIDVQISTAVGTAAWHHIALVRNGTTFTFYLDGTSAGTDTDTNSTFYLDDFKIGLNRDGNAGYDLDGYIDEFRVKKGEAKWTANFTPPTEAYTG